jgi:1-acyl-sn-glycerol-3-phosphate acyltransferase
MGRLHVLLRIPAWLLLQLLLVVLGLASALWSVAALLLHPLLTRERGRRLGRGVIAWGYRGFWLLAGASGLLRLDARALAGLRDEPGLIIAANHPSLLDALVLVSRLPRSACIMKASLKRNPLLGPGARLARYVCNDTAIGMVQRAVADLREGGQLVMFPEGTRTTADPVGPFHPSFTLISRRAQAPIQTVFIDTDSPYLAKGWPLWRLPPLPVQFRVRLGRRFDASADHEALCADIERYFRGEVRVSRLLAG